MKPRPNNGDKVVIPVATIEFLQGGNNLMIRDSKGHVVLLLSGLTHACKITIDHGENPVLTSGWSY